MLALILTKTRLSENHEKKLKRTFVGNDAKNCFSPIRELFHVILVTDGFGHCDHYI